MALDARQAQELLDRHHLDGAAVGGFSVQRRSPYHHRWNLVNSVSLVGFGAAIVGGPLTAADRLVIVTNLGVAMARKRFGLDRLTSWELRPEDGVRFELDSGEVNQADDTVELTVGDSTYYAFGPDRDAAFRLHRLQPERRSDVSGRPAPGI